MFLKYKVDIPVVPGKLVRKNRGGHTYIEYEYDRIYDPVKQYTYPKRASIGRVDPEDPTRMTPNENFLKYFPDAEIPEEIDRSDRSPYLNIGTYVVLHKLIQDCKLKEILDEYMDEKDTGFLLDLACYSIIEENNAGQYYPDYAYEHALFTPDMKIYTDSKVSDFLHGLKPEQSVGFLKDYIIGSCKYRNEKIGVDELDLIRDYASVFGKGNNYHYYIFSKGGFTDGLLQAQERGEVRLITLEDLYK